MMDFNDILKFWFGTTDLTAQLERNQAWFRSTDAFDAEIREKFQGTWRAAGTGALDHWMDAPDSCLALIVLLDQFPRNMYRGQGRAYASDFRARVAARRLLDEGWDQNLGKRFRTFAYLPFEHSESVADQERAVALMTSQGEERGMKTAQEHLDAILRFGRFPHRNAPMGRTSTADELAYLKDPPKWGKSAIKNADPEERAGET